MAADSAPDTNVALSPPADDANDANDAEAAPCATKNLATRLRRWVPPLVGVAAFLVLLGLAIMVGFLAGAIPFHTDGSKNPASLAWAASAGFWLIGVLPAVIGLLSLLVARTYRQPESCLRGESPTDRDRRLYDRALIGLGYAVFVLGIVTVVAIAVTAESGLLGHIVAHAHIDHDAPPGHSSDVAGGWVRAVRLIGTATLAILGALFFVANSLRLKRGRLERRTREGKSYERYDNGKMWSGLWFRIGEAVVFTLVLYLVVVLAGPKEDGEATRASANGLSFQVTEVWMPILGLIMGMFVKPAEGVIFGLGRRMLDAVGAVLGEPSPRSGADGPGVGGDGAEDSANGGGDAVNASLPPALEVDAPSAAVTGDDEDDAASQPS